MIIKVKVIPNSTEDKIDIVDNFYKIKVKAAPIKGKANQSVLEILSRHFNVKEKEIKIKNPSSRIKIVEIINA